MRATGQVMGLLAVVLTACGGCASGTGSSTSGVRTSLPPLSTAASYARTKPGSPPPDGMAGSISGHVGYPSEFLPAEAVYAISTDGNGFYVVETMVGQQHYRLLGLPAGDYFVLVATRMPVETGANPADRMTRFGAAYTKSVLCGLSVDCPDHTLVPVHVGAGAETAGIDPGDWYAGENAFPLIPGGGSPALMLDAAPPTFHTSEEAAIQTAQSKTGARFTTHATDCKQNTACVWFTSNHIGQGAAYYVGTAGSNSDVQTCAFYVLGGGTAWKGFVSECRIGPDPFPAVGSTGQVLLGMGETGCVNVRAAPGKGAKVVGCLAGGTVVRIDNGPVFIAPTSGGSPSTLDVWWHIGGRGWMVQQYLHG